MPIESPIEERLLAVEAAIADLQRRITLRSANWLEQITGSFKDEPAFEEVLALSRAFRDADRRQGQSTGQYEL